jgi:hypothetical protein
MGYDRSALFSDMTQHRVVIFKGQEFQEDLDFLTLEDGTNTLPRNVGKWLSLDASNIP